MEKEEKKHWLVTEYEYFIDPHGTWDDTQADKKFVTDDPSYAQIAGKYCTNTRFIGIGRLFTEEELEESWDLTPIKDAEEDWSGEDGYNCRAVTWNVEELFEDDVIERYKKIIKDYNSI